MPKHIKYVLIFIINFVVITVSIIFFYNEMNEYEKTTNIAQVNEIDNIHTYSPFINEVMEENEKVSNIIHLKNYDVFFLGNEKHYMQYKGKRIELLEALINNTITMEDILNQAEYDYQNNIASKSSYLDGGSIQYRYETLSIIKMNSLNGNRNVYIGSENLDIDTINN